MNRQALERAISFIDTWLPYRFERLEMPGFVVAIAHDNEILFEKAFGLANIERGTPMSTDHIFRIASHSKTFAATAIMQLAEKKLLNIDECVVNYVPWIREHRDPRINNVTIRQLMTHSAGIIRDGLNANYWALAESFWTEQQFKEELLKALLVFDNNRQMKYSNVGYTLLGTVIEQVSGQSFKSYVQANIIEPLNLEQTGPDYDEAMLDKSVTGYSRRDVEKQRLPLTQKIDTMAMSSATGFYSTAADMCKYFAAHFVGSGKLISDESKKEMQRPQWAVQNSLERESYGLGFCLVNAGARKTFGHGGGFPGQITRSLCDPKDKLIVIVLTNCIDGEAKTMAKGIYAVIDQFVKSAQHKDNASLEQLRRFQGRFMNLWSELDIVENGGNLLAVHPNSWTPFGKDQDIEKLVRVDDCTLKVEYADGYSAEGETVKYEFEDSLVKSIKYAGTDMLPEAEYNKAVARVKKGAAVICVPTSQ